MRETRLTRRVLGGLGVMVLACALDAGGAAAPGGVTDDPAVAAELARLNNPDKDQRATAVRSLVKLGKPAAPALVRTLGDSGNDARAAAAEALRQIFAVDPAAAPNYHEQKHWEQRVAGVKVGMMLEEAVAMLLPDATPEERKAAEQMGMWSGRSGLSDFRLDDYWVVRLQLVDHDAKKVSQPPTLLRSVRSVWVGAAPDYAGTWVTWFVNGQKAHEIQYRNGRYDGTFTAFRDDGSRSFEQHYRDHVADGTDTGWYPDGRKSYEGRYKNGKQDGTWQHWHKDGTPQTVNEYVAGQHHGVSITWLPNGQKRYERHYRNGKQHGLDTAWDEQGKLLWNRAYRDGELVDPDAKPARKDREPGLITG